MGLFDRIWRAVRANINHLIGQLEDPEKILEQAVLDMQDDLVQLRQAVAQAIATQKRTERQAAQARSTAEDWQRRAQLALQKGDEHLAREALTRRKSYVETAAALSAQLEQQAGVVVQLKQNMMKLEGKIQEAKAKKDLYIARARSAQAAAQLQEALGRVGTGSAMNAFDRMEEKVQQLEAKSEALAELSSDDLEQRFARLGQADEIDAELATMKQQMGQSNPAKPLPPTDPDFKKMR
jgi:phage shock protein A